MISLHPHPELVPLLVKHEISWEAFIKRGRPPVGIRAKRTAIISELHRSGMSWKRMAVVTGLSLMTIHRNTDAVGCAASHANRVANAVQSGMAGKGRVKTWLSEKLKQDWATGQFDFHRGRQRSEAEKETLRAASKRPEVREKRQFSAKRRWANPVHRQVLLDYHRSEEIRQLKSSLQTQRMLKDPEKWTRGRGGYIETTKCSRGRVWTRSSFERAAIRMIEDDPLVLSFEVEPLIILTSGRQILPDLLVFYVGNSSPVLVEVKAAWVLTLPQEHKYQRRLRVAQEHAAAQGWGFMVWTEKDFGEWLHSEKS